MDHAKIVIGSFDRWDKEIRNIPDPIVPLPYCTRSTLSLLSELESVSDVDPNDEGRIANMIVIVKEYLKRRRYNVVMDVEEVNLLHRLLSSRECSGTAAAFLESDFQSSFKLINTLFVDPLVYISIPSPQEISFRIKIENLLGELDTALKDISPVGKDISPVGKEVPTSDADFDFLDTGSFNLSQSVSPSSSTKGLENDRREPGQEVDSKKGKKRRMDTEAAYRRSSKAKVISDNSGATDETEAANLLQESWFTEQKSLLVEERRLDEARLEEALLLEAQSPLEEFWSLNEEILLDVERYLDDANVKEAKLLKAAEKREQAKERTGEKRKQTRAPKPNPPGESTVPTATATEVANLLQESWFIEEKILLMEEIRLKEIRLEEALLLEAQSALEEVWSGDKESLLDVERYLEKAGLKEARSLKAQAAEKRKQAKAGTGSTVPTAETEADKQAVGEAMKAANLHSYNFRPRKTTGDTSKNPSNDKVTTPTGGSFPSPSRGTGAKSPIGAASKTPTRNTGDTSKNPSNDKVTTPTGGSFPSPNRGTGAKSPIGAASKTPTRNTGDKGSKGSKGSQHAVGFGTGGDDEADSLASVQGGDSEPSVSIISPSEKLMKLSLGSLVLKRRALRINLDDANKAKAKAEKDAADATLEAEKVGDILGRLAGSSSLEGSTSTSAAESSNVSADRLYEQMNIFWMVEKKHNLLMKRAEQKAEVAKRGLKDVIREIGRRAKTHPC